MRVKTEERRQAIINTAKQEFMENGYSQTSMSTIARKVGGSKATLYNYFKSKEEIFEAVLESAATQMITAFKGLSSDTDLEPTLNRFGINYLTSLCAPELLAVTKVVYSEVDRSDISRYYYEKGPKRGWQNVADFLDAHIENGNIKSCNTHIAAMQLKALLEAEIKDLYILRVIPKPDEETIKKVVERAVTCFITLYGKG